MFEPKHVILKLYSVLRECGCDWWWLH